jgi:hypothetical protein
VRIIYVQFTDGGVDTHPIKFGPQWRKRRPRAAAAVAVLAGVVRPADLSGAAKQWDATERAAAEEFRPAAASAEQQQQQKRVSQRVALVQINVSESPCQVHFYTPRTLDLAVRANPN